MSDVGSGRGGWGSAARTAKATRARVGPDLAFINPGPGTRPHLPLAARVSRRAHAPCRALRLAEELRGPPSACEDWTPTQGWATKWEKTRRPYSSCLGLAAVRARAHKPYVPRRLIRWRRRTFSFWTSDWRLFPRLPQVWNGRCFPLPGRVAPDWLRDARTQPDSPSNVAVGGVPSPWAELRLRLRSPSCCILTGRRFRTGTAPQVAARKSGDAISGARAARAAPARVLGEVPRGLIVCGFPCRGSCHASTGVGVAARRLRRRRALFSGFPFRPRNAVPESRGSPLGKWRKQYVVYFLLTTC